MMAVEIKAVVLTLLAALGIFAPVPDVLGGLMLGLAGCYAAFIVTPPADRMTVWATLFVGLVTTVFFAVAHPHLPLVAAWPLQLVMGAAGALSRYIVKGALNYGRAKAADAGNLPGPGSGDSR